MNTFAHSFIHSFIHSVVERCAAQKTIILLYLFIHSYTHSLTDYFFLSFLLSSSFFLPFLSIVLNTEDFHWLINSVIPSVGHFFHVKVFVCMPRRCSTRRHRGVGAAWLLRHFQGINIRIRNFVSRPIDYSRKYVIRPNCPKAYM